MHEVKVLFGIDAPAGVLPDEMAVLADAVNLPAGGRSADLWRRLAGEGVKTGVLVGWSGESGDPAGILQREVGAMKAWLGERGGRVAQVKLCGRLGSSCEEESAVAEACVDWMESELEGVPLVVGAGGLLHAVAEARGVPLLREICADRGYADEARLVPPGAAGEVIRDPAVVARRLRAWVSTGFLETVDGNKWLVEVETVCVHADSPGSLEVAREVRNVLGERAKT